VGVLGNMVETLPATRDAGQPPRPEHDQVDVELVRLADDRLRDVTLVRDPPRPGLKPASTASRDPCSASCRACCSALSSTAAASDGSEKLPPKRVAFGASTTERFPDGQHDRFDAADSDQLAGCGDRRVGAL
jgi:hypothetical protein